MNFLLKNEAVSRYFNRIRDELRYIRLTRLASVERLIQRIRNRQPIRVESVTTKIRRTKQEIEEFLGQEEYGRSFLEFPHFFIQERESGGSRKVCLEYDDISGGYCLKSLTGRWTIRIFRKIKEEAAGNSSVEERMEISGRNFLLHLFLLLFRSRAEIFFGRIAEIRIQKIKFSALKKKLEPSINSDGSQTTYNIRDVIIFSDSFPKSFLSDFSAMELIPETFSGEINVLILHYRIESVEIALENGRAILEEFIDVLPGKTDFLTESYLQKDSGIENKPAKRKLGSHYSHKELARIESDLTGNPVMDIPIKFAVKRHRKSIGVLLEKKKFEFRNSLPIHLPEVSGLSYEKKSVTGLFDSKQEIHGWFIKKATLSISDSYPERNL
ncbi:MAG: hypothetical protein K8R21_00480 [Leptospira sp.]|nr:hypothetical protein [Leptospira sp.]